MCGGGGEACVCAHVLVLLCVFVQCLCVCVCAHFCAQFRYEVQMIGLPVGFCTLAKTSVRFTENLSGQPGS